jgi:aryl-alcohol dehydrogenase-like predicted oxidoreductase
MPTDPTNLNSAGLSRHNIIFAVQQSLERLQTDYIDLLQLDGWDANVSVTDTVRHLNDLIRSQKVNYFGVCDFKGWQFQKFIDTCK